METTGNTSNKGFLQQFAVKSVKNKSTVNNRSVIYNRCSSEKQDTLEQQDGECINLCIEYGLEIIKTYSVKESAETDDRKAFQEMLKFCAKQNIAHIVVYNFDRFTRSGDVGLLKQLRDKGIRVHSVKQRVDDETSSGQFSQSLFVLFAKWENDQRRDRIILGQRTKLRRGEWIGNPTIGYEKRPVPGKKPQCFINEDGLKLRQAFYWKDHENLTNLEIIERLEKMGLKILAPQLTRIFRNPFYCGYITSRLLEAGEIIPGKHEPLVSEEVFLRVNGIVNKNPHGYNSIRRYDETPLKVSVYCDKCQRPLTSYSQKKGAYLYYKCPNLGCNVNIRNLKLHDLFTAELSKLTIHDSLIRVIKTQFEATYNMLHASEAVREKPMKDELTRLKNELETMEFNLATSKITPELFTRFSAPHREKIKQLEESLQTQLQSSSNLEKMLDSAIKMSCNLLNIWKLLDYNGKVRLQKLVFPEGLRYNRENHALRTLKINPIISAITSISTTKIVDENNWSSDNTEKLHSLYQMFGSSNFFWECLEEINTQIIEFEQYSGSLSLPQNPCYQTWSTGVTVDFNYKSASTTAMATVFTAAKPEMNSLGEVTGNTLQRGTQ